MGCVSLLSPAYTECKDSNGLVFSSLSLVRHCRYVYALLRLQSRAGQHLQIKMREISEGEMAQGHDAGESTGGAEIIRQKLVLV